MKVKVPAWAHNVDKEQYLVLFWMLRTLSQLYPPNSKAERKNRNVRNRAVYDIHKKDIHIMLGRYHGIRKELYSWSEVEPNLEFGDLTNEKYRFMMDSWRAYHEVELQDQRSIEMVIYLSGCLNANLIEPASGIRTEFGLNDSLRDRFRLDDMNPNWYHEEEAE